MFHTAGVLDDGVVTGFDTTRLARVLAPKVDGALHLHELTTGLDLSAFVLYSSAAGVIGSSGQAGYAAANMFLDALTQQRRTQGLPALSLAWGFWETASAMTAHLNDTDLRRMGGTGILGLTQEEGMTLLDAAWQSGEAVLVPVRWDHQVLRERATTGTPLPSLLRRLVRAPKRRAVLESGRGQGTGGSLRERLAPLPETERRSLLTELVASHAAAALGHTDSEAVPIDRPFKELGFDSLISVEFRNRLNEATGLRLPATLVFDRPTPEALTDHLLEQFGGTMAGAPAALAPVRAVTADDPIVIVGMACRFPGGIHSPEQLWDLVAPARTPSPASRTTGAGTPLTGPPTFPAVGGFLYDAGEFDAGSSVSPRVKRLPWTRSSGCCWRPPGRPSSARVSTRQALKGSRTGVFIGGFAQDYGPRLHETAEGTRGTR